jgi:hypothetical protein
VQLFGELGNVSSRYLCDNYFRKGIYLKGNALDDNIKNKLCQNRSNDVRVIVSYLIASLFQSDAWGNILSPINALTATGILLYSYLGSNRSVKISVVLLLFALACAAWSAADILWAIIDYSGGEPDNSAFCGSLRYTELPAAFISYCLCCPCFQKVGFSSVRC